MAGSLFAGRRIQQFISASKSAMTVQPPLVSLRNKLFNLDSRSYLRYSCNIRPLKRFPSNNFVALKNTWRIYQINGEKNAIAKIGLNKKKYISPYLIYIYL